MADKLLKYVGQYSVQVHLPLHADDVPRDADGVIMESYEECYVPCRGNVEIRSGSRGHLWVFVGGTGRMNSVLKQLEAIEKGCVKNLIRGDEEGCFEFPERLLDQAKKVLFPRTKGKTIKPYKNKIDPKRKKKQVQNVKLKNMSCN